MSEPAAEVVIEMVDIAFLPNDVTIPADTQVTIILPNRGGATHNFYVDELGIESADTTSGTTASVTFTAPAGTYEFYCNIPGHKQAGMVGTLVAK